MIKAEVVSEIPDISTFRDSWDRLFLVPGNEPSTSFEWTKAMIRHHIKPGDRFFLVRIQRGEEIVCLVPLVARTESVFGQPLVSLYPISEQYNTHSGFLASGLDESVVEAFLSVLYGLKLRWDLFRMTKLLENNPLLDHFQTSLSRRRSEYRIRYEMAAFYLPLDRSYDDYLANRSAKFRNFLRRSERKMAGAGESQVIEYSDPEGFDKAYEDLLHVERHSWKHAHGTAISAIDRQTGFYRDMIRSALETGHLHLQLLYLDRLPIAYNLGYIRDKCYYYLKTSYYENYKPFGPSTFLRARLIRGLIASGVEYFDFPGEPYEWERQWTETLRWHKSILVYNNTIRARILARLNRLRERKGGAASKARLEYCDARALKPPR